MKRLFRVVLPRACFGVLVDDSGLVERNEDLGHTKNYRDIQSLSEHVLGCGGAIEEVKKK